MDKRAIQKVDTRLKMVLFGLLSSMMVVSMMVVSMTGCAFGRNGGQSEVQVNTEEEMDTGAWE